MRTEYRELLWGCMKSMSWRQANPSWSSLAVSLPQVSYCKCMNDPCQKLSANPWPNSWSTWNHERWWNTCGCFKALSFGKICNAAIDYWTTTKRVPSASLYSASDSVCSFTHLFCTDRQPFKMELRGLFLQNFPRQSPLIWPARSLFKLIL